MPDAEKRSLLYAASDVCSETLSWSGILQASRISCQRPRQTSGEPYLCRSRGICPTDDESWVDFVVDGFRGTVQWIFRTFSILIWQRLLGVSVAGTSIASVYHLAQPPNRLLISLSVGSTSAFRSNSSALGGLNVYGSLSVAKACKLFVSCIFRSARQLIRN